MLPIVQLIYSTLAAIQTNRSCLKRVINYLNLRNYSFVDNKSIRRDFKKSIVFEKVNFKYSKKNKDILKDVSFEIYKGEKIGIIGTTGSGKSTLLDLIMGLIKPTNGKVYIDEIDINNSKNNRKLIGWQKSISHVPQNYSLSMLHLQKILLLESPMI